MSMMCTPEQLHPATRAEVERCDGCETRYLRWYVCAYHEGYDAGLEATDCIASAARRYVTAALRPDRDALDAQTAAVERDASWHALVVAVLGRCPMCDLGTCPEVP